MADQIYYEDVTEGMKIPSVVRRPDSVQLIKYSAAANSYNARHFNRETAMAEGLPGVILQGKLRSAFLCQLLTDWVGSQGHLVSISVQQRGLDLVDKDLICTGLVTGLRHDGDDHLVECQIWIENEEQVRTVVGSAEVALPSKSSGK